MHACVQDCSADVRTQPWNKWSVEVQYQFLRALTPSPAARVSYSVSDECLIPSILSLYGLSGALWQTNGAPLRAYTTNMGHLLKRDFLGLLGRFVGIPGT